MLRKWFEIKLWKRIMGALLLGVIFGMAWPEGAEWLSWLGEDVFVRLIRMLIIPLIFATLTAGVISMGDPKKLGTIGLKTVGLYVSTKIFAIITGLVLGAIFVPMLNVDFSGATPQDLGPAPDAAERVFGIIPMNPFNSLASGDVLPVIFFAILLGVGILLTGRKAKPIAKLFNAGSAVMIRITHLVMEIAPFGVFALIAAMVARGGFAVLGDVLLLAIMVYLGCFTQMLLIHGGLIKFVLKLPYLQFFRGALDAQMVAYSTSSSSATLPVTISVAQDNLGIKPVVASSVLPLGSTVNMDGTALYVTIVALFAANAFGISLELSDYFLIAIFTTLVSIGSAGVPSASIFLLGAVLPVIGVTNEQVALTVGFLLSFDRVLDMMRTVVNITGDLAVATGVAKWEDELDEGVFRASPIE